MLGEFAVMVRKRGGIVHRPGLSRGVRGMVRMRSESAPRAAHDHPQPQARPPLRRQSPRHLYAGAMLRFVLEAGYATAWKHIGPDANLVLRRVLNMECLRPVPVGVVVGDPGRGAVPNGRVPRVRPGRHAARRRPGAVGRGTARVRTGDRGRASSRTSRRNCRSIERPDGETWERLADRMKKLLRLR